MGSLAGDIRSISSDLRDAIANNIAKLQSAGTQIQFELRGERFADLARSAVEIIDRNLYERSCDVRWWATDSAVVDALAKGDAASRRHASERLATILRSYTVYLDLWIADREGRIVATGRPELYPGATGADVSHTEWFQKAMATVTGDDFAVCDIQCNSLLGNAAVASYSTAIRAGGGRNEDRIGALGIFFDWTPQAQAIVESIGLTGEERDSSRVMLLSADNLVLASSDRNGMLSETYDLRHHDQAGNAAASALVAGAGAGRVGNGVGDQPADRKIGAGGGAGADAEITQILGGGRAAQKPTAQKPAAEQRSEGCPSDQAAQEMAAGQGSRIGMWPRSRRAEPRRRRAGFGGCAGHRIVPFVWPVRP